MEQTQAEKRIADIVAGGAAYASDLALLEPLRPKPYTQEEQQRYDKALAKRYQEHADERAAVELARDIVAHKNGLALVARYFPTD